MMKFSIAGAAMAAVHIAIVVYTVTQIMTPSSADWTVYWRIFLALDFPISLAVVPLTWLVPPSPAGPLADFANFWWPLLVHGLLGTFWWYVVGMGIGERLARLRTRKSKPNDAGN